MKKSWIIALLLLLAASLRTAYLLQAKNTPILDFLYIDSQYYHNWAAQIAGGDLLGGTRIFFMAPFYAYFLALIYHFAGNNPLNPLYIQIMTGSLSVLLVFLISDKYFNRKTALIASVICAVYPVFIFYDVLLLKENLMVFFLLLFAYLYPLEEQAVPQSPEDVFARERSERSNPAVRQNIGIAALPSVVRNDGNTLKLFLSGTFIGINALMRANIFLLLPFLAYYEYKRGKNTVLKKALIFSLGLFIIVAPVALRNKIVGGEWVITVAEGGMNFWTGNNPKANGAYVGADFIRSEEPEFEDEDFRVEASKRLGREVNAKEASDYWYKESFHFIFTQPARLVWLGYRKFLGFIHNTELPSDLNYYFARDFSSILRFNFIGFGLILPFAAAGFIAARGKFKPNFLLLSIVLSNLMSSLIFFNSSRYRLPVVPFFMIYCGYFFSLAPGYFSAKKDKTKKIYGKITKSKNNLYPLLLLCIPVFILANYNDGLLRRIAAKRVNYINASTFYSKAGDFVKAEDMLKRCLVIDPAYALGYNRYSELLYKLGRNEEAEKLARMAASYNRNYADGRINRETTRDQQAYSYFQNRDFNRALITFQTLLKEDPAREKELRNNIGLCYLEMKEFDKAEAEFMKSVIIDGRYYKAIYNLGLLSERSGNTDKAIEYYKKALAINPNYEKAGKKLRAIQQKIGQTN